MTNKIFIIAHAPLASALRDCALHIFPDAAERVLALDVPADEPCEQTFAAARAIAEKAASNLLVLTDVFGATPSNVTQRMNRHCDACGIQVREVTGVNLPMLLRALCHVDQPLDMLEQSALVGGGQGIFTV
ncbi:MAG: PTS fructose transporter subunit IIA, partial [Brachymonas sp.]|nr:PTS fructose transporter subunit IIA [Brachymonas sp.]